MRLVQRLVYFGLLGLLVAACGTATPPTPTALPTATPSPTAIPQVPSPAPPTAVPITPPTLEPTTPPNIGKVNQTDETVYFQDNPGSLGTALRILNPFTPIFIIGRTEDSNWLQVRTSDDSEGWVRANHVSTQLDLDEVVITGAPLEPTPIPPTNTPLPTIVGEGTVTIDGLRIREAPEDGEIVTLFNTGDEVTIKERTPDGEWILVSGTRQREGWVTTIYVDTDDDIERIAVIDDLPSTMNQPTPTPTPTTTPEPDAEASAEATEVVGETTQPNLASIDAPGVTTAPNDGLNFRPAPDLTSEILQKLPYGTPLDIIGRSSNNAWLEVIIPSGEQGWVYTSYVRLNIGLSGVEITAEVAGGDSGVTSGSSPSGIPSYVSGVSSKSAEIYRTGQSLGNRPNVFSKIGDSLTVATYVMYPFGWGTYDLGQYGTLQSALNFFASSNAREGNSFANVSLAADNGWTTSHILDPAYSKCGGASPLICELDQVKPSVALIMIGTNDSSQLSLGQFGGNLRTIVQTCIDRGVIPVLFTIPRRDNVDVSGYNATIIQTAQAYDVPLVDYHLAMLSLPNTGLSADGVHPSSPPGDFQFAAHLRDDYVTQYGYVMRNLTVLQALDAVWRFVIAVN